MRQSIHDRKKSMRPATRVLAGALLLVFLLQDLGWAASQVSAGPLGLGPATQSASIKVSPALAKIRSFHKGSSGKIVIQIQDAHTNFSAQKNLSSVLEELVISYGLSTLFVEGSSGDVSLNRLRQRADKAARERVAKKFLASGEINGAEYLNIASDHHLNLVGVEDKGLYERSLQAYAAVVSVRDESLADLGQIQKRLKILKGQFYPKEILLLDESLRQARSGKRDFSEAYTMLAQAAERYAVPSAYYPNFFSLKDLKVRESQIDFAKANEEFEDLVEELTIRNPELIEALESAGPPAKLKFKSNTTAHLYETFLETARRNGIDVGRYGQVVRFTEYLRAYARVDFEVLLSETKLLEQAVFDKALKDPRVRAIERFSRYLGYLEDLFALRILREDYDALRAMRKDPHYELPAILGAVNRALYDLGNAHDILIYRKSAEENLKSAETFYELTLERDREMVDRLVDGMEKSGLSFAALLTGGYHTAHISSLLRERGVSYVVVTPHVTHETNVKRYERLLLEQLPHEKNFRRLSAEQNGSDANDLILEGAAKRNGGEVVGRIEADLSSYSGEFSQKTSGARLASHWYSNNPYLMPREFFNRIQEYKKESQSRIQSIQRSFNRTQDDLERFLETAYAKEFLENLEEDPFEPFLKAQKFFPASSDTDRDRILELLYWYRTYQLLAKAEEPVLRHLAKYQKKYPVLKEIKNDDAQLDKKTEGLLLTVEDHDTLYEELGKLHDGEIAYLNRHMRDNGRIHNIPEKDLRFFDAHNIVVVTKKTIEDVLKSQKKALDRFPKGARLAAEPAGAKPAEVSPAVEVTLARGFSFLVHFAAREDLEGIGGVEAELFSRKHPSEALLPQVYSQDAKSQIERIRKNLSTLYRFRKDHNEVLAMLKMTSLWTLEGETNPSDYFIKRFGDLVRSFSEISGIDPENRQAALKKLDSFKEQYTKARSGGVIVVNQFFGQMEGIWRAEEERSISHVNTFNKFINWMHTQVEETFLKVSDEDGQEFVVLDLDHARTGIPSPVLRILPDLMVRDLQKHADEHRSRVIVDGANLWVRQQLGTIHRAQIYAYLMPPLMDGRVEIVYFDTDEHKKPNVNRLILVEKIFRELGFTVERSGLMIRASFGKTEGAMTVEDLRSRLLIALEFLNRTVDISTRFRDLAEHYEKWPNENNEAIPLVIEAWVRKVIQTGGRVNLEKSFHFRWKSDTDGIDDYSPVPMALLTQDPASVAEGENVEWGGKAPYLDHQVRAFQRASAEIYSKLNGRLKTLGLSQMPPYDEKSFGQLFIDAHFNDMVADAILEGKLLVKEGRVVRNSQYVERIDTQTVIDLWEDKKNRKLFLETGQIIRGVPLDFTYQGTIGDLGLSKAKLKLLTEKYDVYALRRAQDNALVAGVVVAGQEAVGAERLKEMLLSNNIGFRAPPETDDKERKYFIDQIDESLKSLPKSSIYNGVPIQGYPLLPGFATGILTFDENQKNLAGKILWTSGLTQSNVGNLQKLIGLITEKGNALDHLNLRAKGYQKPRVAVPHAIKSEDEKGQIREIASASRVQTVYRDAYHVTMFKESEAAKKMVLREGDILSLDGSAGVLYWNGNAANLSEAIKILAYMERAKSPEMVAKTADRLFELIGRLADEGDVQTIKFIFQNTLLYRERSAQDQEQIRKRLLILKEDRFKNRMKKAFKKIFSTEEDGLGREVEEYLRALFFYMKHQLHFELDRRLEEIASAQRVDQIYYAASQIRREAAAFESVQEVLKEIVLKKDLVDLKKEVQREVDKAFQTQLEKLRENLIVTVKEMAAKDKQEPFTTDQLFLVRRIGERILEFERLGLLNREDLWTPTEIRDIKSILERLEFAAMAESEAFSSSIMVPLGQLNSDNRDLVGNKAANLGWLSKFLKWYQLKEDQNLNMAMGFAITSRAYDEFLSQKTPDGQSTLKEAVQEALDSAVSDEEKSKAIHSLFTQASLPEELDRQINERMARGVWAARSSTRIEDTPVSSAAGLFKTTLGANSPDKVKQKLKETWASLFSEPSISYRGEMDVAPSADELQGAIIQSLVDADVSGVITSVDITNRNRGTVMINAGYGLGQSIVDTQQDADRILVDRITRHTEESRGDKLNKLVMDENNFTKSVPTTQEERGKVCLDEETIRRLVDFTLEAERWFGYVVDIEFAIKDNVIYPLQIRPVPGYKVPTEEKTEIDRWRNPSAKPKISGARLADIVTSDKNGKFTPIGIPVIVIVEDDPVVLNMHQEFLPEYLGDNYQYVMAETQAAAINALESAGAYLALVITDNNYPKEEEASRLHPSGVELVQIVKEKGIPVILVSAGTPKFSPTDKKPDRFFEKPFKDWNSFMREAKSLLPDPGSFGARLSGTSKGRIQSETLLPRVRLNYFPFYPRKIIAYDQDQDTEIHRLEFWIDGERMKRPLPGQPPSFPDLFIYSASLSGGSKEQGLRGVRVTEMLRGTGFLRTLVEKFFEEFPGVTKTHPDMNNLIFQDLLTREFGFAAPEGTEPAGYVRNRKFYVKREYFNTTDLLSINGPLFSSSSLESVDDLDLLKDDPNARPIYLGVSLERKNASSSLPLLRENAGARLAEDAKANEVAETLALIYKDILERGIPDSDQKISTLYNASPIWPYIKKIYLKAELNRYRSKLPVLLKNIRSESNTFTRHINLIYDFVRSLGPEGSIPPYYLSGDENRREIIRRVFETKGFEAILDPGRADEIGEIGRGGMTIATLFTFRGKSWDLSFAALNPNRINERMEKIRENFETHKDPLFLKLEIIGILWELGAFLAQGDTLQYLNPQGSPAFSFHLKSEGASEALILIKKLLTYVLGKSEAAALDAVFFKDYAKLRDLLEAYSYDKKPRLIHQLFDTKSQKLSDVIREGKLQFSDKLRVMLSLSRSMQTMHKKGVVHRDIKPDNILVRFDAEGRAAETMIFDFGTATRTVEAPTFWEAMKRKTFRWNQATADEVNWLLNETAIRYTIAPGTKGFKPADEGQKNLYWGEADLFALGATYYQILTGQPLDGTKSQAELDRLIDTTQAAPQILKNLLKRLVRVKLEKDIHPDKITDVLESAVAESKRLKTPDALRNFIDKELPKALEDVQSFTSSPETRLKKAYAIHQRVIDFILYLGDTPDDREMTVYSQTQDNITPYLYLSKKSAEINMIIKNLESSRTRFITGARLAESPFESDPNFMRFLAGHIWKAKGAPKNQSLENQKRDYDLAVELVRSGFPDNGSSIRDLAQTIWVAKGSPNQSQEDQLKDWLRAKRIVEVLIPQYAKRRASIQESKKAAAEKSALQKELDEKARRLDAELRETARMLLEGYQVPDPKTGKARTIEGIWTILARIRSNMEHLTTGPTGQDSEASKRRTEVLQSVVKNMYANHRKGETQQNITDTIRTLPRSSEAEKIFSDTVTLGGSFAKTDLINKATSMTMGPTNALYFGALSKEMLSRIHDSYSTLEEIVFLLKIYAVSSEPTRFIQSADDQKIGIDLQISPDSYQRAIEDGVIPAPFQTFVKGSEGARLASDLSPDLTQQALEIARVVSREAVIEGPAVQVPIFAAARGTAATPLWIYSYSKVSGGDVRYTVSESHASTRFRGSRTLVAGERLSREDITNGRRLQTLPSPGRPAVTSPVSLPEISFNIRESVAAFSEAGPILRNVAYWKRQNLNLLNSWHKFMNEDLVKTPEGSVYVLSVPLETTFDPQTGWVLSPDLEESVRILVRELEAQDVKGDLLVSFTADKPSLSDRSKDRVEALLQSVEKAFGRNKVRLVLSELAGDRAPIEGVLSGLDPKLKLSGISMGFDYKENGKNLDYDAERAKQLKLRLFGIQMPKENEMVSTLGLFIVGTLDVQARFAIPLDLLPYVQRTKSRKLGISIFVIRPHRINAELKRFFVNLRSTETSA